MHRREHIQQQKHHRSKSRKFYLNPDDCDTREQDDERDPQWDSSLGEQDTEQAGFDCGHCISRERKLKNSASAKSFHALAADIIAVSAGGQREVYNFAPASDYDAFFSAKRNKLAEFEEEKLEYAEPQR